MRILNTSNNNNSNNQQGEGGEGGEEEGTIIEVGGTEENTIRRRASEYVSPMHPDLNDLSGDNNDVNDVDGNDSAGGEQNRLLPVDDNV